MKEFVRFRRVKVVKKFLILILLATMINAASEGRPSTSGRGAKAAVPRVDYKTPQSDSTIDPEKDNGVLFSWEPVPIPAGNRAAYRFLLNKEPGYNTVAKADFGPEIFSIMVSADKFEPGCRYSWHVKQRDWGTMEWGEYDTWYFDVVKK